MRLTPDTIARVKACKGVYSVRDTARHFGISKTTVSDVWNDRRHGAVAPAPEPDNVKTKRISADVIKEDGAVLLSRGLTPNEVAQQLSISERTLYRHIGSTVVFSV